MKQKFLLFTGSVFILFLSLSSYKNGPAAANQSDFTGRIVGQNCFMAGCHSGGSGTTTCTLQVRRKDWGPTSTPVTGFISGMKYIVTISGQNTLPKFGFQVCAVSAGASVGTFSALPTGVHEGTATGGIKIVEHSAPLAKDTGGMYKVSFEWTAPSITTPISFHGILNAVNGDSAVTGDKPSGTVNVTLQDHTSIANLVEERSDFIAYPNPVVGNVLNIHLKNAAQGNYTVRVYDAKGSTIYNQATNHTGSDFDVIVNTEKWSSGLYFIQLQSDYRDSRIITIVK
jgi:hypothetical protein